MIQTNSEINETPRIEEPELKEEKKNFDKKFERKNLPKINTNISDVLKEKKKNGDGAYNHFKAN